MIAAPEMVERAAVEIALQDPTVGRIDGKPTVVQPLHVAFARAAIEAHEAALEAAGLVIVPREPTEAMREAGNVDQWQRHHSIYIVDIFRAMIDAALEVDLPKDVTTAGKTG